MATFSCLRARSSHLERAHCTLVFIVDKKEGCPRTTHPSGGKGEERTRKCTFVFRKERNVVLARVSTILTCETNSRIRGWLPPGACL